MEKQKNILGDEIDSCCENPITGFLGMDFVTLTKEIKGYIQYV